MKKVYEESLLKKGQVAAMLGLTSRGVECLMARRAIPYIRISSRCVRFHWPTIQKALEKFSVKEI